MMKRWVLYLCCALFSITALGLVDPPVAEAKKKIKGRKAKKHRVIEKKKKKHHGPKQLEQSL